MDEKGKQLDIKDILLREDYVEYERIKNNLIYASRTLKSNNIFSGDGTMQVTIQELTTLKTIIEKTGFAYTQLDPLLRNAIEYFSLQEFFGGAVQNSKNFDADKTLIVSRDEHGHSLPEEPMPAEVPPLGTSPKGSPFQFVKTIKKIFNK